MSFSKVPKFTNYSPNNVNHLAISHIIHPFYLKSGKSKTRSEHATPASAFQISFHPVQSTSAW